MIIILYMYIIYSFVNSKVNVDSAKFHVLGGQRLS